MKNLSNIPVVILQDGCPCGRDCCNNPQVINPEHECENHDGICEDCFVSECESCGKTCCCDL